MVNCPSCGANVTGKKFCQQCGTPVRAANPAAASGPACPRCNGAVNAGAAFCMHCGAALNVQTQIPPPPPATRPCPSCYTEVAAASAFCTNCGHNMNVAAGAVACTNCGKQNNPGTKFCGGCGAQLGQTRSGVMPQTNYGQPPSGQPYPPQPYQQPQQYGQPQYPQGNYPVQPMMGQPPMVLRCPTCMAMAPLGTPFCQRCRTNLAGVVPVPAQQPAQQGGLGGFLQSDGGKLAAGALGGAAAVIGGQMLFNGLENAIERRVEDDMGFGGHHNHHHREEDNGILGNLGKLADDIGLI